jgi:glycogen(starch) synthase
MSHRPESRMLVLMTTDAVGGVWNYCVRLAEALENFSVRIALATMGPAPSDAQRQEVRRLAHVELYESTFKLEWMHDPWDDVARAGEWLLRLEHRLRPDILHLNGYVHAALPWSHPVLLVAHSCVCSWFDAVRGQEPPAEWDEYRRRVAQGLRHADLVTAPTQAALETLDRHYGSFPSAGPIYNGSDPVDPAEGEAEPVVLTVGRLWDPAKGIAVLDRAARDIPWPVLAAGAMQGPDGQALELKNIQGLGCLDQRTLHSWYHRASIFVSPSIYEPFGLAALEAGLAGCALVLSDLPSLREIWSDAAVFVPPQDHRAFTREVNRLIAEPPLRQEYRVRASQKARTYTLGRMAHRYYQVYRELLRRKRPPSRGTAGGRLSRNQTAAIGVE